MLVIGVTFAVPKAFGQTTMGWVSSETQLGDAVTHVNVIGDTFKVAIVATDLVNFYAFDIQANWNSAYVHYVSHTVTVPAESFPAPNPPSTYGGALNAPIFEAKNIVDQDGGIPGADPASMCWFEDASIAPAAPQSGDVTLAVFTFTVVDQPFWSGGPVVPTDLLFHFTTTTLVNSVANPIDHTAVDFHLSLYPRLFDYPPVPTLDVTPKHQFGGDVGSTFPADVTLTVDPFWDVAGFYFILHYDPTLIKANTDTIDPDGWFASFWPSGIFVAMNTIDNVVGEVCVVFLGLPGVDGVHVPPYGMGRLLTVTFESIYVSTTYPPQECDLALWKTSPAMPDPTIWNATYFKTEMAGFPHPERSYTPWNSNENCVPLPHVIGNGHYTAWLPLEISSIGHEGTSPYPYVQSEFIRPNEPVTVTANITDQNNVASSILCYRTNGGAWWNTTMSYNSSTSLYAATIPGQQGNSTVEFFVIATDILGATVQSSTYSYDVQPLLLGDVNGDGKVSILDVVLITGHYGQKYP
jgi:hypothetical protein